MGLLVCKGLEIRQGVRYREEPSFGKHSVLMSLNKISHTSASHVTHVHFAHFVTDAPVTKIKLYLYVILINSILMTLLKNLVADIQLSFWTDTKRLTYFQTHNIKDFIDP